MLNWLTRANKRSKQPVMERGLGGKKDIIRLRCSYYLDNFRSIDLQI